MRYTGLENESGYELRVTVEGKYWFDPGRRRTWEGWRPYGVTGHVEVPNSLLVKLASPCTILKV